MSNINDPDFVSYLNQENSYAETFMADTRNLQRELFLEMNSRIPSKISTPPERWGPWFVVFSLTLFNFLSFWSVVCNFCGWFCCL